MSAGAGELDYERGSAYRGSGAARFAAAEAAALPPSYESAVGTGAGAGAAVHGPAASRSSLLPSRKALLQALSAQAASSLAIAQQLQQLQQLQQRKQQRAARDVSASVNEDEDEDGDEDESVREGDHHHDDDHEGM